jgi:membrane fusion protein, adhesin transport system
MMRRLFKNNAPATPQGEAPQAPDAKLLERIKTLRTNNAVQALDDQLDDLYFSALSHQRDWTRWGIHATAIVLLVFSIWAALGTLDEVTSGIGKVIPTSREQVIQSMEAGLLAELMVQEGDTVEAMQPLLRIDDVKLGANVQESQSKVDAMLAAAARLRAESRGGEPVFATDLQKRSPELVKVELGTLNARRRSLDASVQAQQQALRLAQDELRITEPLAAKGLVSDIDVLRIRRSVAEARGRIDEAQSKYRADAAAELARVEAELGSQSATLVGRTDSLNRTVLRAPKRGVVKNIRVTTIGAVVQSGQDILEIVPMDDVLLVETRIRPSDIAFLRPGLPAIVKISAYDSGIYGWLEGQVQHISPDTLHDEVRKDETYYRAVVSTRSSVLRTPNGQVLPIIPGMQAQVDIKTGQKSVLSYLFKPVLRAREALRER